MENNSGATPSFDCSIIIPTRDMLHFLEPCIESIVRNSEGHPVEIVVVDNGSEQDETLGFLEKLKQRPGCHVLSWDKPFNFSAINNFAADHCHSEILCFLNNDVEITDPKWLEKLLPLARRTDVGAVGCVLLYPDKSIQHAGIVLDEFTIAKHLGVGEAADFLESENISKPFAVDAATAACLFMRRQLFVRLNGFNENKLAVAFNDVDLCLRLGDKGLPVLLHPEVKLIHHESVSRKSDALPSNRARAIKEHSFMQARWRHRLAGSHYENGVPPSLLQQVVMAKGNLDETIKLAADQLFRETEFDIEPLVAPAPTSATLNSSSNLNWQQQYQELEKSYASLEAHSKRIEEAHQLIENSIFWRMTAPLRGLRDLLTGQSNSSKAGDEPGTKTTSIAGDEEIQNESSGPGQENSSRDNLNQASDPKSASTKAVSSFPSTKQEHDNQAKKELGLFLNEAKNLVLPTSGSPVISILLVFYNQAHLSLLCLQSIVENADVPVEVIIVDNASADSTDKLLAKLENVTLITNEENLGFVRAVNLGAAKARGTYLLLLNNDALLEPAALSSAVDTLESDEKIGAVGGKIKLLDGSLQEAGSIIWNDGACLGYGRGKDPDAPEYAYTRDVDYCSGAFLLFATALFKDLGGFDEEFAPAYYEESDFCIRLQKQGYRIVYEPAAVITHYEFASSGGMEGASVLQASHREILCQKHAEFLAGHMDNDLGNVLAARTANDYPNVLIIDDRVPHPSLGAGYPRCSHILHELGKMPLNISFYPLLFPEDDWSLVYSTVPKNIEILLGKGRAGLRSFLAERKNFYQFVMVSRVHNMEFFNHTLAAEPDLVDGAQIIYDAEAVSAPREVLQRRLWGESVSEQQEQELISRELEQARMASSVVAVSNREAKIYNSFGYENTVVLGHTMAEESGDNGFESRKGILFVGALRDEGSPNVDSLLWFIINVLPLIENSIPGIKLTVVGDNSAPSLATIENDNVLFTGRLDSIQELYDSNRVFIAPTRFAAGIPHKVHEAANKGLPSVTTSLLATQLEWSDENELLVADSARDFADQCIRLHEDEGLWRKVRDSGLEAVARDCSQEVFRDNLKTLFGLSS